METGQKKGIPNTLGDLNNHLFAELERLGEDDLKDEALREELGRAKGIANIATQIIANANLCLETRKFIDDFSGGEPGKKFPPMLREQFLER
jgi:hypothetical protein